MSAGRLSCTVNGISDWNRERGRHTARYMLDVHERGTVSHTGLPGRAVPVLWIV